MLLRLFSRTILALLILCVPSQLTAGATIFVPADSGSAWEVRELVFVPKKRADGGLTVQQIDAWLNQHRGMREASQTCFMDFARPDEIVSPDRQTQNEINTNLNQYPNSFAEWYEPEPGTRFLVRVGIFELCGPSNLQFMALVITDESGTIKEFDALDWNFIRLFKRDDGKINILGCYACGEVRELVWDKFNDRFYFEWIGH